MDRRRPRPLGSIACLLLCALVGGCRSTPITGRPQLLLVPEQQEIAMGLSAYEETKSNEKLSTDTRNVELVNRVGQRIAQAAERPDYQWEFRLVASTEKNAYCLPGGKVTVHEGILPVCGNEAGLAVVMSHEVAHALARHGGERISHGMAVDGVKRAVDYFTKERDERQRELIMQAYGVGTQYGVILPYSRKRENEADHMGLMLMAQAGYDPSEAPRFWQRFGQLKEGSQPIEFLSTHPSDEHRVQKLTDLIPEALAVYEQTPSKYGTGEALATTPAAGLVASGTAATPVSPSESLVPMPNASAAVLAPPFAR